MNLPPILTSMPSPHRASALDAAANAFVLAAQAHIEASMGDNRQVAPFFYDPSRRGPEDARVTETRAALNDAYLEFQNVWIQKSVEWSGIEADPYAGMRDELNESAPELCLLYAVHFANVKDTPSGAGVQSVAESMLRSVAQFRGQTPGFRLTSVLTAVKPVDARVGAQSHRAMQLTEIARNKIRETRARITLELPPSSVAAADVVRDLTLPPAVDYWYDELGKWDFGFKKR